MLQLPSLVISHFVITCGIHLPNYIALYCQNWVSLVLLGGPEGQGARVEVSPDTSRA